MAGNFSRGFLRSLRPHSQFPCLRPSVIKRVSRDLHRQLHVWKDNPGLLAFQVRNKRPKLLLLNRNAVVCNILLSRLRIGDTRLNSSLSTGSESIPGSDLAVNESLSTLSSHDLLSVTEPAFSSLGLGGYSPVGLIQTSFETMHITFGMPWFEAIIAGTIAFRLLLLPLMIKGQINTARLNSIKPELDRIQTRLKELANTHDQMAKMQATMELQKLFRDNNCHPVKALITPLIQLPVFISFFLAIRRMANAPVESMKDGGALWFPDLVSYDPTFALPVIASLSMLLAIEIGAEGGVSNQQQQTMKMVFRCMSLLMIPLTAKFPAYLKEVSEDVLCTALFVYWVTSNMFSLGQVAVLKIPSVKAWCGIPEPIKRATDSSKTDSGGFLQNFKAGYKNAMSMAQVKHDEKMKEKRYKQLAEGPIQQTYDYNPRVAQNEQLFKDSKLSNAKKGKK